MIPEYTFNNPFRKPFNKHGTILGTRVIYEALGFRVDEDNLSSIIGLRIHGFDAGIMFKIIKRNPVL
uniref:Uncharacterized protein n=1 Tax=Lepeophtheirus salmonis TaxID=72036 RepID=A0A0K2T9Y1_LEPSM